MPRIETITALEGAEVSVALRNGDRLDGCQLVAGPRGQAASLWLYNGQADVFVPLREVVDLWEAGRPA